jgi:hypothetical protein
MMTISFYIHRRTSIKENKFNIYGEHYYSVLNPEIIIFNDYIIFLIPENDYLVICYKNRNDELEIVKECIY